MQFKFMLATSAILACVFMISSGFADGFAYDETPESLALSLDGKTWLRTMTTPFKPEDRGNTYKVFTHIYDFEGKAPITKGAGGKFTHHRGMFIGWNHTHVDGRQYDTWHMKECHQRHVAWAKPEATADTATQTEEVHWMPDGGEPFVKEVRRITAAPGEGGLRVFDFQSTLTSLKGAIQLRGDLQHAGMQVRLADEVSKHEETTSYILPEGIEEQGDNRVEGAWWACCSAEVGGKRYWIVHMTPQTHPMGVPVYSIRRYARFGAFFEPDLAEGKPLELNFRVVVSEKELDQAACQALYDAYVKAGL
jgi:Family of unknown function (DUF6807)